MARGEAEEPAGWDAVEVEFLNNELVGGGEFGTDTAEEVCQDLVCEIGFEGVGLAHGGEGAVEGGGDFVGVGES